MTADNIAAVDNNVEEVRDEYLGPGASGLYDPSLEREACGVGFIVAIDRKRSHKVCLFQLFLYKIGKRPTNNTHFLIELTIYFSHQWPDSY